MSIAGLNAKGDVVGASNGLVVVGGATTNGEAATNGGAIATGEAPGRDGLLGDIGTDGNGDAGETGNVLGGGGGGDGGGGGGGGGGGEGGVGGKPDGDITGGLLSRKLPTVGTRVGQLPQGVRHCTTANLKHREMHSSGMPFASSGQTPWLRGKAIVAGVWPTGQFGPA